MAPPTRPQNTDDALRRIYKDPKNPGSFSGVKALYREAKKAGIPVGEAAVKEFLQGETAYTKHGRVIAANKGVLNERIITSGPYDLWEADLMDFPKARPQLVAANRNGRRTTTATVGPKYILTVIDVFTKHAWAEPLMKKTLAVVLKAFQAILDRGVPAQTQLNALRTDAGTEFFNRPMKALYKARGINHYRAQKEPGAAVVERFNRTLGEKFARYVTNTPAVSQMDLVAILPDVVTAYNNSLHSAIKDEPADLQETAYRTGGKDIHEVLEDLRKDPDAGKAEAEQMMMAKYMAGTTAGRYKDPNPLDPVDGPRPQNPLRVGDLVRVLVRKNMFEKGRAKTFSDEVWKIRDKGVGGNPNAYRLEDEQGEEMIGKMYRRQLQRVSRPPEAWELIVLRRRHLRGRNKEILVQWVGYPHLRPEWIPAQDVDEG